MKNFRRKLPSLDGLVFFEAAARHNSFTVAAGELNVTQAAVSKRIKDLEARLGLQLFHRDGRKLTRTGSGQRLYERTTMALDFLEDAVAGELAAKDEIVQVAANSAVSVFWLGPRLGALRMKDDNGAIRMFTSDRLQDLLSPENHLAITYGHGAIPGWDSTLLFHEKLVPVARPDYFPSLGTEMPIRLIDIENPGAVTLLEYDRVAPDWVNWKVWIATLGIHALRNVRIRKCGSYANAIGEAISGNGIALGSLGLIDGELQAGRLGKVGDMSLETGRAYYLSAQINKALPALAQTLRNSLLAGKF